MQEFINRLIHCGYSPCDACSLYRDFMKEYDIYILDDFISSLEEDLYVDRV